MTELKLFEGEPRPYRWTVDDYLAMAEAGIFEGRGRVELIEGELLQMSPQQAVHAIVKTEFGRRLADALHAMGSPLRMIIEVTVAMPADSAVEPDIAIIRAAPANPYIGADEVALIVEVANTTVEHDLGAKAALYAKHQVPEYWVVEVTGAVIHRHCEPVEGAYRRKDAVALGDPIASITIDGLSIATDDLD